MFETDVQQRRGAVVQQKTSCLQKLDVNRETENGWHSVPKQLKRLIVNIYTPKLIGYK